MKKLIFSMLVLSSVSAFAQEDYVYCQDKSKQQILLQYEGQGVNDGVLTVVEPLLKINSEKTLVVLCTNRPNFLGLAFPKYSDDIVSTSMVNSKNLFVPFQFNGERPKKTIIGYNKDSETFLKKEKPYWFSNVKYITEHSPELKEVNRKEAERRIDRR